MSFQYSSDVPMPDIKCHNYEACKKNFISDFEKLDKEIKQQAYNIRQKYLNKALDLNVTKEDTDRIRDILVAPKIHSESLISDTKITEAQIYDDSLNKITSANITFQSNNPIKPRHSDENKLIAPQTETQLKSSFKTNSPIKKKSGPLFKTDNQSYQNSLNMVLREENDIEEFLKNLPKDIPEYKAIEKKRLFY